MKMVRRSRSVIAGAFAVCCLAASASAFEPTSAITRVEEDWVAYVRNPDSDICAPQIVNLMSPTGTTTGPYGLFELNHVSLPNFSSGGFQVQGWVSETHNSDMRSNERRSLTRDYDRVNYTVAMEIEGDRLRFTLKDGRSRNWGRFLQSGLSCSVPRGTHDLSEYSPEASVQQTTINVGAHRIELLVQEETRYYTTSHLVHTDTEDRVIHRFHELVQYISLADYEANADEYTIEITE